MENTYGRSKLFDDDDDDGGAGILSNIIYL